MRLVPIVDVLIKRGLDRGDDRPHQGCQLFGMSGVGVGTHPRRALVCVRSQPSQLDPQRVVKNALDFPATLHQRDA